MAASLDTVLDTWLTSLMRCFMRDFQSLMQATGLSAAQLQTLMYLYARGPAGVGDIAGHLGVTAAASQMVERLVRPELLQRTQVPHDRRGLDQRRLGLQRLARQITPQQRPQITRALSALIQAQRSLEA